MESDTEVWKIKTNIQKMCVQLSSYGEDIMVVTLNMTNKNKCVLGSTRGIKFLLSRGQILEEFEKFCCETVYKPDSINQSRVENETIMGIEGIVDKINIVNNMETDAKKICEQQDKKLNDNHITLKNSNTKNGRSVSLRTRNKTKQKKIIPQTSASKKCKKTKPVPNNKSKSAAFDATTKFVLSDTTTAIDAKIKTFPNNTAQSAGIDAKSKSIPNKMLGIEDLDSNSKTIEMSLPSMIAQKARNESTCTEKYEVKSSTTDQSSGDQRTSHLQIPSAGKDSRLRIISHDIDSSSRNELENRNLVHKEMTDSELNVFSCLDNLEIPLIDNVCRDGDQVAQTHCQHMSNIVSIPDHHTDGYLGKIHSDSNDDTDTDTLLSSPYSVLKVVEQDNIAVDEEQLRKERSDDASESDSEVNHSEFTEKLNSEIFDYSEPDCSQFENVKRKSDDDEVPDSVKESLDDEKKYEGSKANLSENEKQIKVNKTFDRRFKCKLCTASFNRRYVFLMHMETVHNPDNERRRCNICNRTFQSKKSFEQHMLMHNLLSNDIEQQNVKIVQCKICEKIFGNNDSLKKHMTYIHSTMRPFKCDTCNQSFKSRDKLNLHKKHHFNEHSLCKACNEMFPSYRAMRLHYKIKHNSDGHQCEICGMKFKKNCELQCHKMDHTGIRPFKCKICNKTFKKKYALCRHELTHGKKYKCDVCCKTFTQESLYMIHKQQDHIQCLKEKCECIHCGKSISSQKNLTYHMLTCHFEKCEQKQLSLKFYTCEFCSKILPDKPRYENHKNVHTGEKPHKCRVCFKSFASKCGLRIHSKIHVSN